MIAKIPLSVLFTMFFVSSSAFAKIQKASVICAASKENSASELNKRLQQVSTKQSGSLLQVQISQPALSNWNGENRICVTAVLVDRMSLGVGTDVTTVICAANGEESETEVNSRIEKILEDQKLVAISAPGLSNWNGENRICVTLQYFHSTSSPAQCPWCP